MDINLKDDQQLAVSVAPVDSAGNTATVDGKPTYTSSDESVVTIVQPSTDPAFAGDPNSADIVTTGKLGAAQVTVEADADLGPDIEDISDVLNVTVGADSAVGLGIKVGTARAR